MADTGWKAPGSAADQGSDWANVSQVLTDNGLGSNTIWGLGGSTTRLAVTNFSMGVPAGATIDGIEVRIDKIFNTSGTVALSLNTTKDGSNPVGTATESNLTAEIVTHGGATSLWGTTWTESEVNASTFGFLIIGYDDGTLGGNANIDFFEVRVYYTGGGGGGGGTGKFIPVRRRG